MSTMELPCGRTQVLLDSVLTSTRPSAAAHCTAVHVLAHAQLWALKSPVTRTGRGDPCCIRSLRASRYSSYISAPLLGGMYTPTRSMDP
jgi:hypothetical protein